MITKVMGTALAVCLSTGAFAGVQHKKAKRGSEEKITKTLPKAIAACGNKELKVEIVWAEYDKFITDPANLKEIGKDKTEWILSKAGVRAKSLLEGLVKLCADKDYKEEVAKLTLIKIHPQAGYKKGKTAFTLSKDGTNIKVQASHYLIQNADDFKSGLKKLY